MNLQREKNITRFNNDVDDIGSYVYTNKEIYSAYIATKRQSDEIIDMLTRHFSSKARILDVGCGDGVFTIELLRKVNPKSIVGFDVAAKAVVSARKRITKAEAKKIKFVTCNIYEINKKFAREKFDVGVVRGVLHHLYNPEVAIEELSKLLPNVIVLEPNGYNPILKIIEKVSRYHRLHEEKSYFPPLLNKWFIDNGYVVKEQKFVGVVPYFCPASIAKILKLSEPFFEKIPYLHKFYVGTNVILYEKKRKK